MTRQSTRFELDEIRVAAKLSGMTERAQFALDTQVLRDTTPFVPYAQGDLSRSGSTASDLGKGAVRWYTPYARDQYYKFPNKSGAVHPRATKEWFEAAKAAYLPTWVQVAKRAASRL